MTCTLTEKDGLKDWCERHKMRHRGHYAKYAVDEGEKGQKFRKLWDEQANIGSNILRSLPAALTCIHNTGVNGTTKAGCGSCKTYGCNKKGTIRLKDCLNCSQFEASTLQSVQPVLSERLTVENTTRNLLYHIYPVVNHGRWNWNVEQVCGRLKAFNGQIIVAIVTDPPEGRKPDPTGPNPPDKGRIIRGCDSAEMVKAEFAKHWSGKPIHFMEFENDPHLREVKPLMPMLSEILTDDPYSVTLYAQAKGVTRAPGHIAHRWTEVLYEIMFDYFPLAIEQLNEFPVTGCFKKLGPGWHPIHSNSDYHYSGSWMFFRSAELFKRNWQFVNQFWSGIEPYPSQHFHHTEAGCMFHTDKVPAMNLYNSRYFRQTVLPLFDKWRIDNEKYRTTLWPK